ncbi:MAG TPA: hypothetical protein VJC06_03470 [Candidatus Paceibacterota bacterium]
MLVTKCDICRKEIKNREHIVLAGTGSHFATNSFCSDCGKPVLHFLNKIKNKKNGKQKRK